MSSFNAKVARAKKEKAKGAQSNVQNSSSGKGREEKHEEEVSVTENISVEEQGELVAQNESATTTMANEASETTEALYGEDQEDQNKPKWQREIPLDRVRPNPFQNRKTFDPEKLNELANGMKEHGWVGGGLPVRAATGEPNVYELVWGERRWRAARIAGLKAIPCVVSIYSDDDMIEKGLLENIQREDLSNLEEGQAYVNLLALRTEQGKPRYSIRRLATRIGKDKSYIEDRLKYARVPVDIQQLAVDQPDISPRIIHELGEISKILKPEERAPVVEGVREGMLRIEDVREIRKDVEQQVKQETTTATILPIDTTPATRSGRQDAEDPAPLTIPQVSVATDISSSLIQPEEQTGVGQEPSMPAAIVPSQEIKPVATAPISPLASTVIVSVFEKTLKRDNEAIERIFQRISSSLDSLTAGEERVLRRFLTRWNESIREFMSKLEPEAEEEQ